MEELTWYIPQEESPHPRPVVIGLPGFTHRSERTRIDNLLEKLTRHGIFGVRVNYPGIIERQENGRVIECHFNLQGYIQSAKEAREYVSRSSEIDATKIGLLSSSMGSGIVGHWLAQNPDWSPSGMVAISPLSGWRYYGNEQARSLIQRMKYDIIIPLTEKDKQQGIVKRVIPKEYLEEVISTDAITSLGMSRRTPTIPMMTIIGTNDNQVSQESMDAYHRALADPNNEELKTWTSGHAVPEKRYEAGAITFFKKYLLNHS